MVEQVDLEATIVKTDSPVARERVHLHEHGERREIIIIGHRALSGVDRGSAPCGNKG